MLDIARDRALPRTGQPLANTQLGPHVGIPANRHASCRKININRALISATTGRRLGPVGVTIRSARSAAEERT
jgi:hypothetical protein